MLEEVDHRHLPRAGELAQVGDPRNRGVDRVEHRLQRLREALHLLDDRPEEVPEELPEVERDVVELDGERRRSRARIDAVVQREAGAEVPLEQEVGGELRQLRSAAVVGRDAEAVRQVDRRRQVQVEIDVRVELDGDVRRVLRVAGRERLVVELHRTAVRCVGLAALDVGRDPEVHVRRRVVVMDLQAQEGDVAFGVQRQVQIGAHRQLIRAARHRVVGAQVEATGLREPEVQVEPPADLRGDRVVHRQAQPRQSTGEVQALVVAGLADRHADADVRDVDRVLSRQAQVLVAAAEHPHVDVGRGRSRRRSGVIRLEQMCRQQRRRERVLNLRLDGARVDAVQRGRHVGERLRDVVVEGFCDLGPCGEALPDHGNVGVLVARRVEHRGQVRGQLVQPVDPGREVECLRLDRRDDPGVDVRLPAARCEEVRRGERDVAVGRSGRARADEHGQARARVPRPGAEAARHAGAADLRRWPEVVERGGHGVAKPRGEVREVGRVDHEAVVAARVVLEVELRADARLDRRTGGRAAVVDRAVRVVVGRVVALTARYSLGRSDRGTAVVDNPVTIVVGRVGALRPGLRRGCFPDLHLQRPDVRLERRVVGRLCRDVEVHRCVGRRGVDEELWRAARAREHPRRRDDVRELNAERQVDDRGRVDPDVAGATNPDDAAERRQIDVERHVQRVVDGAARGQRGARGLSADAEGKMEQHGLRVAGQGRGRRGDVHEGLLLGPAQRRARDLLEDAADPHLQVLLEQLQERCGAGREVLHLLLQQVELVHELGEAPVDHRQLRLEVRVRGDEL